MTSILGWDSVSLLRLFEQKSVEKLKLSNETNKLNKNIHKRKDTGPINSSVVTLSRKADTKAVNKHRQLISGQTRPFVICAY